MNAPIVGPPPGVELWLLRQPGVLTDADRLDRSILDDAERNRAGNCRRSQGGHLYAAAHIALRRLLAHRIGVPAQDIDFVREPCPGCGALHGRPAVNWPGRPSVHFSLSHGDSMVLVGLAPTPVGVDVEALPGVETVRICAPALHPVEFAEIRAERGIALQEAFGKLWTRKEAYLKGIGTGLGRSLDADYLGPDLRQRPPGWTVRNIPVDADYAAAAAWRDCGPLALSVRRLSMDWLRHGGVGTPYGETVLEASDGTSGSAAFPGAAASAAGSASR